MSKLYSASQYDGAYKANKLGNWEVPDTSKVAKPSGSPAAAAASKTADGRTVPITVPIVNASGHIVKGAKTAAAFAPQPAAGQQSAARWPQPNPTIKGGSAATMGYKGIQTDFLPTSTVPF